MRKSAPIFLLGFITLFFIWPLFKVGYTAQTGSLEPATLVMARRVAEQGIWGWFEGWYLGFPFRFAGPPASWWVLGAIEKIGIFDLLAVYRILKALALVAFPITFYFLARRVFGGVSAGPVKGSSQPTSSDERSTLFDTEIHQLTSGVNRVLRALDGTPSARATRFKIGNWKLEIGNSHFPAFLASFFLIMLPSVGYIFKKFFVLGSGFGFAPAWMQQEFSRSLGLALLPLVLIFYWRLLEKINYSRLVATIIATALLFLTDGVTSLALLVGLTVIVIIEAHKGDTARKVAAVGLALVLAFLLDAFFFTPQNIRLIASSPSISGIGLVSFIKVMVQAAIGLGPAVLVVASMKLLSKGRQSLAFIWLWLLPFIAITLLFYFSNRQFLTEYTRFLPEMEMGIALLLGYLIAQKASSIKYQVLSIQSLWSVVVLGAILITVVYSFYKTPARWQIFKTNPNIKNSVEYQIAKWLDQQLTTNNKQLTTDIPDRVFLSGSTAFWLNEFAPDVWQVRGGIDQASTNPSWAPAVYHVRTSPDAETSLLWLKALRVGYLVVHDQSSGEYYHDFVYPAKFEGKLEKVFDNQAGDRIYRIDSPMASVTTQAGLKDLLLPDPAKRNERQALDVYTGWLQAGKRAKLEETSNGLLVKAEIGKDEVLALGITYDRGWQVKDLQGEKLKTAADPLGNLVIFPQKEGEQTITLKFQEGVDLWLGIAVSLATLVFIRFILSKKLPIILERAQKGWEEEEE